jgi:hypothetical protein
MGKRIDKILTTQMFVKIKSNSPLLTCWGIARMASQNALTIKSIRSLALGTVVDIEIFMMGLSPCIVKGAIRGITELRQPDSGVDLEVELVGKDATYISMLKFLDGSDRKN